MPPITVAPAAAPGKNIWGGTTFQAASRFMVCIFFVLSAVSKLHSFDKDTGGPVMSWFGPKLDMFFAGIKDMTGVKVPISKAMYPQILLCVSGVEFLGAVLFASDIRFGAWLLVLVTALLSAIIHNFWDYPQRPAVLQNELTHFVKNVAIIGGLLHYLASATGTQHKNKYERTLDAMRAEKRAQMAAQAEAAAAASTAVPQPEEEKKEL